MASFIEKIFNLLDTTDRSNEMGNEKDNQNESFKNCVIEKISYQNFMKDHLDLDEEPSEMEDIDEGFDCVPATSIRE